MPTTISNRELVLGAYHAATTGDIDGFLGALHPEVEVWEPNYLPYGGLFRGHQGFLRLFEAATRVLDFPTLQLVSATADDDRTVLLMTCRLVSNGQERYITELWVIRDELIREVRVFWSGLPE